MVAPINSAVECGGTTGFACPRYPLRLFFSVGIPSWDVGAFEPTVSLLESQGYPVEFHSVMEGHTWGQWRGTSDEMLTFFFRSD